MTDRREVCMGFGDLAQMYIEQGWGREITKEEALAYLKQNEEEGLIFRPGNSQEMDFVCSCCYCCCGGIASLKKMPNPADFVLNIDWDYCKLVVGPKPSPTTSMNVFSWQSTIIISLPALAIIILKKRKNN